MNFQNNPPDDLTNELNIALDGICKIRQEIIPLRNNLFLLAQASGMRRVHLYNGPTSFSINEGLLLQRKHVKDHGLYIVLHELYHQYQVWGTDPNAISIETAVEAYMGPRNEASWKIIQQMEVEAEEWANRKGHELLGDKFTPNTMYSDKRLRDFASLQDSIRQIAGDLGIDQWPQIAQRAYRYFATQDRDFPRWWE